MGAGTARLAAGLLWLAAAACASPASGRSDAEVDATWLQQPQVSWFGVYIEGRKAGHAHVDTRVEHEAGLPVWVRRSGMTLCASTDGAPVDTTTVREERFEAAPPYRLLRSSSRLTQRGVSTATEVVRRGEALELAIERGGERDRRELPPLAFDLRDVLAEAAWLRSGPPLGARLQTRLLDTDSMSVSRGTTVVVDLRAGTTGGAPISWREVERRRDGDDAVERERVDREGRTLWWSMGTIELRREPPELAQRLDARPDLRVLGTAPVDRPLGEPRAITRLYLEAVVDGHVDGGSDGDGDGDGDSDSDIGRDRYSDGDGDPGADAAALRALPDAPGQRLQPFGRRAVRLLIEPAAAGATATPDEIARSLRETLRYPCRDASVVALAQRAVGGARDPAERLSRLVAFVADFVDDSHVDADHLSVHDVIAAARGDCSDHVLLFTTLARACGLPARPIAGLVYLGDDVQAFGPHEWCEVVLEGRWRAVDPTWGQVSLDATHVRLGPEALASPPAAGFRLRVLEVVRGG